MRIDNALKRIKKVFSVHDHTDNDPSMPDPVSVETDVHAHTATQDPHILNNNIFQKMNLLMVVGFLSSYFVTIHRKKCIKSTLDSLNNTSLDNYIL